MTVWVIEEGEYESRHIVGVASSANAAADLVKAIYPPPYLVAWTRTDNETLTGVFEAVPNYSTKHTDVFEFTEYEVDQSH